ncbi:uncharacterized protein LY89DRAFT_728163 [Mollisia scopiformis]|uniref:Uncharacterized protein n=1 Tax=Mollisia scopiformis TaxID=149040 RepID=A0A194XT80_MOLSC|nr:uncharacterized protein LY89DRAFT_728163 [Mollisia scopiformis]KUJ23413.1 hypothetical protein LY89DRAFT_728163 [Mollisia scopiformis]
MFKSRLSRCFLLFASAHAYIDRRNFNSTLFSNGTLTVVDTGIEYKGESWTAYEDLTRIDGQLYFVSASGLTRNLTRHLEQSYDPIPGTGSVQFFLGLNQSEVNLALPDLLADELLKDGEPVEAHVRDAVPQVIFTYQSFVGNVQANDTMFIDAYGSTNNVAPLHGMTIQSQSYWNYSYDGLVGGWQPIVRKLWRLSPDSDNWLEVIAFGDADSVEPFIVKTWFRSTLVIDGKIQQQQFSREYPASLPARPSPQSHDFYSALLRSSDYWDNYLEDMSALTLPDQSWADFTKHTFAVELLVRYGGKYPKYGFYDRNYAGSEYDGFQDIFTSSVMANLLWGRFDQAQAVIENYFDWFVSDTGDINMRGPEIPQFGLSLSLLAVYSRYTGDAALLSKYEAKILAWVSILETLHDESLTLSKMDPNYGLIAGWSESDSCLSSNYTFYIAPYWNNNINAARGLKDLSTLSFFNSYTAEWSTRASTMINQTISTLLSVVDYNMTPPYVPVLPITNGTVRECMQTQSECQQMWSHRVYSEMLQPGILPANLANMTINSMRANGITSLGIVANVGLISPDSRDILGFISYGYAQALLLLDRSDEFIFFMYAHRYHVHSRGQWIATEVAGTAGGVGDENPFCVPAAMTAPILMRLALVMEDPDEEILYLGRGVPTAWLETGKEVSTQQAPTRWGRVDFSIQMSEKLEAKIRFQGAPPLEVRVKMRLPRNQTLSFVTVNDNATLPYAEELVLDTRVFAEPIDIQGIFQ